MSRRSKSEPSAWPHGRPTVVCPACGGTGLDRSRAILYSSSRAPSFEDERIRATQIFCAGCEGRGRLTIEKALAGRST